MGWEEKRRHKRAFIKFPVEFRSDSSWQYVEARDISAGGIFIVTDKVEPPQTKIEIIFEFGYRLKYKDYEISDMMQGSGIQSLLMFDTLFSIDQNYAQSFGWKQAAI